MSQSKIIAGVVGLLVAAVILLIWIIHSINNHFKRYLNGIWVHNDTDSKCIIHIDTDDNTMRVISILGESKAINEKLDINFRSQTWFDMYLRKYNFTGTGKISGPHAKILTKKDLQFDLYATESTLILSDTDGDLITFLKDPELNLEMAL